MKQWVLAVLVQSLEDAHVVLDVHFVNVVSGSSLSIMAHRQCRDTPRL